MLPEPSAPENALAEADFTGGCVFDSIASPVSVPPEQAAVINRTLANLRMRPNLSLPRVGCKWGSDPCANVQCSMRLLHTSDWHLGHTLKEVTRDHEHAAFLTWLLETCVRETPDVLVITGD